jgi:outer membrane receptor protein involved in Fe transport
VYWLPLGAAATRSQPNRIEVSLFDTWYLHDTTLVRNGVPQLDLLNGAPSDENGGQPRHKVEGRGLIFRNGIGFALNVGWSSATTVGGSDAASALHFSALGTADARVFGDLERVPALKGADWAKGLRLSLAVVNLFDRRQSVRDETGATPVAFEPGYVDPAGRTLWFSVRKVL